uniref:Palmitoyltransferase n=1 Tax=Hirondellea gigas TaxID=1518452 RepID=A0A2P2ICY8_9CRUS
MDTEFRTKGFSKLLPNTKHETALFTSLVLGVPLSAVWMWLVILPDYHSVYNGAVLAHFLLIVLLVFNVMTNMIMVMRVDASGDASVLPVILKPDWKFCHWCELNSPPRSYHCHECDTCILRRDHHCKFTGCCIGLHNQRFFFMAMIYSLIGLTYGLYYQFPIVFTALGVSWYMFTPALLAPHLAWMLGYISHWSLVVATVHCTALTAWSVVIYVLWTQVHVLLTGQTQYESKNNVTKYNVSTMFNVKMMLGQRWYLAVLSAFVRSPIPSDGLSFATTKSHEEPKDI